MPIGKAAEMLGVYVSTLRRWDAEGKLPVSSHLVIGKTIDIDDAEAVRASTPDELADRLIQARPQQPIDQETGTRRTFEDAARRLGLTRATTANLLRLLEQSEGIAADGDLEASGAGYALTDRGRGGLRDRPRR